jgi:hypothetical protein
VQDVPVAAVRTLQLQPQWRQIGFRHEPNEMDKAFRATR